MTPAALTAAGVGPAGVGPAGADPPVPRLTLTRGTWLLPGALLGGTPGRLLRLCPAGAALLRSLLAGEARGPAAAALAQRLCAAGLASPRWPDGTLLPRATVVVPVRDRTAALARCLAALGPGVDVVVVDDGSRDPAAVRRVATAADARLLRRDSPGGPAVARTDALAVVDAPVVAFLDSDTVPPAGWPGPLLRHLADPAVVAVAPRVLPATAGGGVLARLLAARSPLDLGPRAGIVAPLSPLPFVPSAALVVRRDALGTGFDARLRHGEDVDLVWRLVADGGGVRYDPASAVLHDEPTTWSAALGRRHRYGTSAAPLHRRHPGLLAPVVLARMPAVAAALLLAGRPTLAAAATGAVTGRLAGLLRAGGLPLPSAVAVTAPLAAQAVVSTLLGLGRAEATLLPALPAVLLLAGRRRAAGRAAALATAPALLAWLSQRPGVDPLRWTLACAVDDAAYGTGVWRSCLRERTLGPVLPSWGRAPHRGRLAR